MKSADIRIVRTACRSCHGVCQVLVHLTDDRVVKITGDPESPTSRGYLYPRGKAAPSLLYHPDRLRPGGNVLWVPPPKVTNPLVTATQGLTLEKALKEHMEFTVVSDIFMTPTAQLADLVLPAATWLEQDDVVPFQDLVRARKKKAGSI
jgi:anaerobic selenocysteine-containing dehydrogenase